MLKILLVTLVLLTTLYGGKHKPKTVEEYVQALSKISDAQLEVLYFSIGHGDKVDKGLTLGAIAWRESQLGRWMVNLRDGIDFTFKGSYGYYHALLNSVAVREHIKTHWAASRAAEKLLYNREYAADQALKELAYWEHYWGRKGVGRIYSHAIASYNTGGASYESRKGYEYAKDIIVRTKAIKLYISERLVIDQFYTYPTYGCWSEIKE